LKAELFNIQYHRNF